MSLRFDRIVGTFSRYAGASRAVLLERRQFIARGFAAGMFLGVSSSASRPRTSERTADATGLNAGDPPSLNRTILDVVRTRADPSLAHVDEVMRAMPRHTRENAHVWADHVVAVARRITESGAEPTDDAIAQAREDIARARDIDGEQEIFRETTLVAMGAVPVMRGGRRESAYADPDIIAGIERHAGVLRVFDSLSDVGEATGEASREAMTGMLGAIEKTETPITAIFRMHGSETVVDFSDDGVRPHSKTANQTVLTPRELAHAFYRRYAQGDVRLAARETPDVLILDNCYSGGFGSLFLMHLRELQIESNRRRPRRRQRRLTFPIVITSAQPWEYSWRNQLMHTILDTESGTPRVRDLFPDAAFLGDDEHNSNPIIMLRDGRGRPIQAASYETDTRFG